MPERTNGGVFNDQILSGSLLHFRILGADFSGAIDGNRRPVHNSAAENVYRIISDKATVVIMNPVTSEDGMSLSLETGRSDWTAFTMQAAIRELGVVGVDNVNLSNVVVQETTYDLIDGAEGGGSSTFLGLTDTPFEYTDPGYIVAINATSDGLIFIEPPSGGGDVNSVFGRSGDVVAQEGDYSIDLLSDATINSPEDDQVLTYQNGSWVNLPSKSKLPTQIIGDGETANINTSYFIETDITVNLPDYSDLSIGAYIVFTKAVSAQGPIIQAFTGQEINSDLTIDTSVEYDVTDEIIFVYNGIRWQLQYSGNGTKPSTQVFFTALEDTPANYSGQIGKTLVVNTDQDALMFVDNVDTVFGRTGDIVPTKGDYNLSQLGDVNVDNVQNDAFLQYNGVSGQWENVSISAPGAPSLGQLTDVTLTNELNNNVITYQNGVWINRSHVVTAFGRNGEVTADGADYAAFYATIAQGSLADSALQSGDNISELSNDAAYITSSDVPVTSVAGKVDDVTLVEEDITDLNRVKWQNSWTPRAYDLNDMVRDGAWTMVANKDTSDRAAPVPNGDPTYILPNDPIWNTLFSNSVVYSGQHYTFNQGGWVKRLRVWVPRLSDDTNYRFILINDTVPGSEIVTIIEESTLQENTWSTVAVGNVIVTEGTSLRIYIDAFDSGNSQTFSGGWLAGGDNDNPPNSQSWARKKHEELRFDKEDLDGTNRESELLGVIPNSTILISQTDTPSNSWEFVVEGEAIDNGTYVTYSVSRTVNSGNPVQGLPTTCTFDIPIPQDTQYVSISDYWQTGQPDFASVSGVLEFNGVPQPGFENNAYGIDIEFQKAAVSDDWDLVAVSDHVSSIESGTGTNELTSLTDVSVDTINDNDTLAYNSTDSKWENRPTVSSFNGRTGDIIPQKIDYLYNQTGAEPITTGIISGGALSLNADPTQIDIEAGEGIIVDISIYRAKDYVETVWENTSLSFDTTPGTTTWIYVDSNNAIQQELVAPTTEQIYQRIYLGKIYNGVDGPVIVETFNRVGSSSANLVELMRSLSGVQSGGKITLSSSVTFGLSDIEIYQPNINFRNDTLDPNKKTFSGGEPLAFSYMTQDGEIAGLPTTDVDARSWNPSGNTIDFNGSSNDSSIQYLFLNLDGTFTMLYGQTLYNDANDANAKIFTDISVLKIPTELADSFMLYAFILEGDTDDLTDTGDAFIINVSNYESEATTVTSVFGRTGIVTAKTGDYDLGNMGDVSTTGVADGDLLRFDGTDGRFKPYKPAGDTANRPITNITGQQFFDTDLGIPIWYNGIDWVDSTGNIV